jgi:hypothetical protein
LGFGGVNLELCKFNCNVTVFHCRLYVFPSEFNRTCNVAVFCSSCNQIAFCIVYFFLQFAGVDIPFLYGHFVSLVERLVKRNQSHVVGDEGRVATFVDCACEFNVGSEQKSFGDEFGIVGTANEFFTALTSPSISSVGQRPYDMGREAALAFLERRDGVTVIPMELHIRQSSNRNNIWLK